MKSIFFGLLLASSTTYARSDYRDTVSAFERGYHVSCEEFLVYGPGDKSSETRYILKCTPLDSAVNKIINLNIVILKNQKLQKAEFSFCKKMTKVENFWQKTYRCHKR
jgi:hypothetical protein